MEHSTAILEDAGNQIDKAAVDNTPVKTEPDIKTEPIEQQDSKDAQKSDDRRRNDRKRKGKWQDNSSSMHFGSKGGRNDNKRHKKGDMGRAEYLYVHPMTFIFT